MAKYLDENGLSHFWDKIKAKFADKSTEIITSITRSGTTFTAKNSAGTQLFTFTQQDNTVQKTTTTPKPNGTAAIGSETKYAAGDHVHPLQTTISGNAATATTLETARQIDGVNFDGSANIIHYGTCSTAAATTTKVVDCTDFNKVQGAWIAVKFTVTNTGAVESLKLNVNNTGEAAIKYRGGNLPAKATLSVNRVYLFVYDGTNYELVGDLDTNSTYTAATANPLMDGSAAVGTSVKYAREDHVHPTDTSRAPLDSPALTGTPTAPTATSGTDTTQIATTAFVQAAIAGAATSPEGLGIGYGVCVTSSNSNPKEVTLSGYELVTGGIVTVKFTNAVSANSSLNINNKGTKSIYSDGASIKAHVIEAGDFATFIYDGTHYNLISVNGSTTPAQVITTASLGYYTIYTGSGASLFVPTYNYLESSFIKSTEKGAANGVAPLDANSLIDSQYLPSYVDDVVEAYAVGSTPLAADWLSLTASGTAFTPETGKIYILMADSGDYAANSQFRWGGTTYVKMNDGGVSAITNSEIDTICV